jgi:hypothetical protein
MRSSKTHPQHILTALALLSLVRVVEWLTETSQTEVADDPRKRVNLTFEPSTTL